MSYILFQQQCKKCGIMWIASSGVIGFQEIASPPKKCPYCGASEIEKFKDGWDSVDANLKEVEDRLYGHAAMEDITEDQKKINQEISDKIDHPKHYTSHPSGIECIDVVEHMSFNLGNAIKYIWRWKEKNGVEDLRKAVWYINREIIRTTRNKP